MTQHKWLAAHPYLHSLASFHAHVNRVLEGIPTVSIQIPVWNNYADDFDAGVPLLRSSKAGIDLKPAEQIIALLLERLASASLPRQLAEQIRTLDLELRGSADAPHRAMAWLLHNAEFTSSSPGLLRYLGWSALSRYLHPLTEAFGHWRTEERWLRSYCPTCGALPAMAQLAGKDPGRRRLLSCGHCCTRWWYQRMSCPFCERQNTHRLAVLAVDGEASLRIDY